MSLDSKLTGLVGYWPLGDSTTNRLDSTGISGAITTTGTVPLSNGIQTGTSSAYITNSNSNFLTLPQGVCDVGENNKTFSLWFKLDKNNVGYQWIGPMQSTGSDVQELDVLYIEGNNTLNTLFQTSTGSYWRQNLGYNIIPEVGVWYHYVLTLGGGVATAYLNGNQIAQFTYTGSIISSNNAYTLGNYRAYPNGVNGYAGVFAGSLQEIGIWSRKLSLTEIGEIYNSGIGWLYSWRTLYFRGDIDGNWSTPGNWYLDSVYTTPAGNIPANGDKVVIVGNLTTIPATPNYLDITFNGSNINSGLTLTGDITFTGDAVNNGTVDSIKTPYPPSLLLHMEGSDGSTSFIDSSPNQKQITRVGTPTISTSDKKIGTGSGSFASGRYLNITDLSGLLPRPRDPITVEAWVYSTNRQGGMGIISPKYENGGGATPIPYALCLNDGSGGGGGIRPCFGSYNGNWTMAASPQDLPLNQWTHLAGVYDGSKLYIYVNGVKRGEANLASIPQYTASEFYVGNRWDGDGGYAFAGYIDEVRITNGLALYSKTFTPSTVAFDNALAGYSSYGTVNFKGTSVNNGVLNEPSIFSENSSNTGTINDSVIVKYPVLRPLGGTLAPGITANYQEYPTKLYFYPSNNNDWFNISNWWTDYSHTQQCNFFPGPETTVYVLGNLNSNSGPPIDIDKVIFIDSDLGSGVTTYANYTEFRGTSQNYGVVSSNSVGGTTKFGDYSRNIGTVNTFSSFYEHAFNTGTLNQAEVYYPSVGNAGGSAGNISYKTVHNDARYFNAAVDNNWNTLGNWWNDPGCTSQAASIPGVSNTAYIKANVNSNTGPVAQVGLLVLSGGNISSGVSITGPAELYGNSVNSGTITGNVKLFGYSSNTGTISGNADVYTLSQSTPGGTISGTITYYGTGERVLYLKDTSGTGTFYKDENFTTLATGQITNNTQLVLTDGSYLNNGTPQYNCRSLKILGGAWINQTQFNVVDYAYLYGTSYTYSTIQGRTIFRDTSYNSGLLQGDNLFLDSSYNQYNGTLSGNTLFADNSYNRGTGSVGATITFNPGTHTNAYSGVPTINGPAIFNQAIGGVYTVTGSDYWGGGNFNGTIKGRDGVQITEWVFEDTSRVSYDAKIQGNATFKDYSGTNPYYVTITGNLTTQGNANVTYPRVNGNIICNGDSRVSGDNSGTGYCVGTGTFNDNSVIAGVTIRGNATFNGNSYNGGIVNGDAIFNGFSYNTYNILGNATLNTSYYSGTTPPTGGVLTINGSRTYSGTVSGLLKDSAGSTITQFIFNNTSYLSGNITLPNLVFNNSSYISWNVTVYGDVTFNNTAYTQGNNSIIGNFVCNDSAQFNGTVQSSPTWQDSISGSSGSIANYNSIAITGPLNVPGEPDYFQFNGNSQAINFQRGSVNVNLNDNFSLEAWVNVQGNTEWGAIFSYADVANGEQWSLNTTGGQYFRFSSYNNWGYINGPSYSLNTWTHVVATYYRGRIIIYVNGIASNLQWSGSSTTCPSVSGAYLSIGDNQYGGQEWLNAYVSSAKIYNTALNSGDVLQNFKAGYNKFSLPDSAYADAITAGSNKSVTRGTGIVGGDAVLNGSNQVLLNNDFSLPSNAFSISCFFKATANSNPASFLFAGQFSGDLFWGLHRDNHWLAFGRNNINWDGAYAFTPTLGQWYHAVLTYDGSTVIQYLNGAQVSTTNVGGTSYTARGIYLGAGGDKDSFYQYALNGELDEVGVWSRVLTPTEIQNIYNQSSSVSPITYPFSSPYTSLSNNLKSYWSFNTSLTQDDSGNGWTLTSSGGADPMIPGEITNNIVFKVDASVGVVSNTATFNGNSINRGTINVPTTFNGLSWSTGTLNGATTVTRATGGVLTLTNGQNWQGLYGTYSDSYLYRTTRRVTLFKGGDGATITKIVYTGGATQTSGYDWDPPTLYIDAEFHGAAINYATIVGNVDFYDTSSNNAWSQSAIINGSVTFHDYSQNNAIVHIAPAFNQYAASTGQISFRDYSRNNGIVGENRYGYSAITDAYFYDSGWSYGTVTGVSHYQGWANGVWTLPINFNWAGAPTSGGGIVGSDSSTVTTWVFSGTGSNSATLPGNAVFYGTGHNSGTVTGNATFNDLSTNLATVLGNAYYGATVNGVYTIPSGYQWGVTGTIGGGIFDGQGNPLTTWVFNSGSHNSVTIPGNAVFNGTAYNYGTVTGNATFNGSSYNASKVNGNATFSTTTSYVTSISNIAGTATFNYASGGYIPWPMNQNFIGTWGGALLDGAGLPATIVFSGTSQNQAAIKSPAKFTEYSINRATINSSAEFIDNSINRSTVKGNAIFRGSGYNDLSYFYNPITGNYQYSGYTGTVEGNADVYPIIPIDSPGVWNYNFPLMGNVYGSINYYGTPLLYNNAYNDGDWDNIYNWWQTGSFATQATTLPDITIDAYIYGSVTQKSGGGVAEAKKLVATARPPIVDWVFNYDTYNYDYVATTYPVYIEIPITLAGEAYINGSDPVDYFDYSTYEYKTASSTSVLKSTLTTSKATFSKNSINSGTVTGNADFKTNSRNSGVDGPGTVLGNAGVYYPGFAPITGTVVGSTTYYNFIAPYTLSLSNLDQEYAILAPITPLVLSVSGPSVLEINWKLDNLGQLNNGWLSYNNTTRTFTGTPTPEHNNQPESLVITVVADVPNYVNYSYTQTFSGLNPAYRVNISPTQAEFLLSNPATAITPIAITSGGRPDTTYLGLSIGSSVFNYSQSDYGGSTSTGLAPGLTYNPSTRTISGSPQLPGSTSLNQNNVNSGSLIFDAYVVGSPGSTPNYKTELQFNYTLKTDLIISEITNQILSLVGGEGSAVNIPITVTGGGTIAGITVEGLPNGLYLAGDNSSIVGSIQLPTGSQATNTFTCVVRVSNGYYTNINRSFNILTNDLIIYPEQTISFFGRTALTYNVTVSVDQTNNYVWNEPVGLPPGVTLDPDTGIISGSATAEGTGTATLSITTIGSNKTVTGIIGWTVVFIPITLVGSSFSVMRRRDTSIQILYSGDKPYLWGVTGNFPTGLSLDTATGKISGNTSAPAGAYSITITAEDPGGAFPTSKNYVINVSAATSGLKPTLAITAYTGSTLNYQVTYTGVQPDSWTLVSGNPSPLVFNTATGLITGAAGNSPTTITFTVLATTDGVNTIPCVVTVTVIYPPPIVANQQFSGFRNAFSSFQVINTGGNVVSWYYSGSIPPGMTLSSSTGLISGTPRGVGIFTSRVFAIGQIASDYGDITIAINEIPPVITPNQVFVLNAGIPVKSTTKILTTGGAPTSWTLLNPIDDSTIGVSSGGVITGLPPMETGLYYAYFRASNSSGDSDIVPVTLNVLSAPPIITQNQTQQVYANSQISFQVQHTGGTPTVWTISSNFYGLRVSELGVISGVINATGTFIYVVTAYNDGGSSSARVTIYIDKSLPVIYPGQTLRLLLGGNNSAKISYTGTGSSLVLKPTSELPTGLSLNSATGVVSGVSTKVGTSQVSVIISNSIGSTEQVVVVEVYTVISQDQTFSGAIGAQARFNIATIGTTSVTNWQLASGSLPSGLTLSISGSISGTPLESGTFNITVSGLVGVITNTGNISINIYEVAPQIIPNQRIYIEAGSYLTQGLKVLTTGGFPDSWTGTQITGAPDIYIDQFTGEYKGKAPVILGDYTSYVTASNRIGSSPQTAVTLTVTTPKVVITPGQNITAGAYSNFTQQLRYTGETSAVWEVVNKPTEITINNSGVVSGNITEVGSFSYLIKVTTAGGSTQEYLTINIPGVSPVITPGQVINLITASPESFNIVYSGVADNWELYPGSELPIGVQINNSTGELSWTPPGLIGSYIIDILVSNNYGFTRGLVNIIIKDNPPVIGNNQTFSVTTGLDLLLYVNYTGGAATSWIATGLPVGLVIDSESGAITGRVNNPGSYIANVTATNSTGYSTTTITITALKRIPELTRNQLFILPTEKFINIPLTYTGDGAIIWGAEGLPIGLSINSSSGVISGSSSITGNYTVTVTLQSVEYGTTSGVFKIFVTSNSSKLVISPNQLITATVGIPVSFTPTYIGAPVNWSAPGLPEGLTINPASGTISGVPLASGEITICLFAVDGSNISSAAFITVKTRN